MVTAYQKFNEAIHEHATKKTYQIYIKKFLDYANKDYENLVKLPQSEIEDLVFNYVIHLKGLTEKTGKPSPNSYNTMISPIKLFLDMNDILLNWVKIKKYFPSKVPVSNQLPYTDDDARELLAATTSVRNKAFIHFLAATGCRVGAIPELTIEDVKSIEEGAIVTIYRDTTEEYRTCLTPEAFYHLKKYFSQRINTSLDASLFTTKNNVEPLSLDAAGDVIRHIRKQAKLTVDFGRKSTKGKSQNHAFRKRFSLCLANADIQSKFIEYMMGHYEKQDRHYFKPSDEDLWFQYKKAIKILTLDKSKKIEAQKNDEIQVIKDAHKEQLEEVVVGQSEIIQNMMLELASTKYFGYETRYRECFGDADPDLKKLAKLMSNEEIDDWNHIIHLVQRKKDWTISKGTKSDETLRNSLENREIRELIKKFEEKGNSEKTINQLKERLHQ